MAATKGGSGAGRVLVEFLVVLLLILDAVLLGITADAFNKSIAGTLKGVNAITSTVILLSLIEGTFLAAALVFGLSHAYHYNAYSVGPAVVTALIALGVDILALGFVAKEINVGGQGSREKAIESLVIVIAFFETVYFLVLFGGLHHEKLGVGYNSSSPV